VFPILPLFTFTVAIDKVMKNLGHIFQFGKWKCLTWARFMVQQKGFRHFSTAICSAMENVSNQSQKNNPLIHVTP
jgi:hypothetical protein